MKEGFLSLQDHLEYLQSRGKYWFSRKEIATFLQLTDNAFKKAAHRLHVKGKLSRIRGDFYTIIPPEYRASGSLPASWFIDPLMQHLNQSYYVALLTAASLHGAAHQQPMVFQVMTDRPTRPIRVGQVRMEFICKKSISSRFYQSIKTVTGMMNVSTPEITAFDLVKYMNAAGQVSHVATVLMELAERLRPDVLAKLLKNGDVEVTAAQRLGYLLDTLKLPLSLHALETVLKGKKITRRLLIAGVHQSIIEYNARWHIIVNESVEPDEL